MSAKEECDNVETVKNEEITNAKGKKGRKKILIKEEKAPSSPTVPSLSYFFCFSLCDSCQHGE